MQPTSPAVSSPIFSFFGLRENPFTISPNPRYVCLTPLIEAASQQLVSGIRKRQGLILLTGEVGTGKTLLLQRLLNWLTQQNMPTALINNSRLNSDQLLDLILSDFGIPCKSSLKSDKLIALNRWLVDRYRRGHIPVLIVDEAQGLPLSSLEEIRLLLNLETPREKLLQVVLAGQPELEEKLRRHDLRQLRQRIAVRCGTAPFTLEETHSYIHNRLRIAGAQEPIFDSESIAFVHAYSRGIPRVINLLCEHSLINAYADDSHIVHPRFVDSAAHDCQLEHVESIASALNSGDRPSGAFADIDAMFASISMLADSGSSREPASVCSAVLTETIPAAASELGVQSASPAFQGELFYPERSPSFAARTLLWDRTASPSAAGNGELISPFGPFRPHKAVAAPERQSTPSDSCVPLNVNDIAKSRTALPPTSRRVNVAEQRLAPAPRVFRRRRSFFAWLRRLGVRPWPSEASSRARTLASARRSAAKLAHALRCSAGRLSHATALLFQGWWSSFSADVAVRRSAAKLSHALRRSKGRLSHATPLLFQGWWSSFSADARATWRQLHGPRRRSTFPAHLKTSR